ncbi:CueP family metal-binding protein [Demequina sp. B12]|uniref:CueP family metal-binding protein n=1 Tax=Demequina sp. B12 TaxID=2992757 RepID=UPI00237BB03F|nr:CueP family metal-binding protein [Demequina sp. B12]MDE0573922.1 CueP family metal-binding protein [Demequina sp. B12]
MKRSVLIPVALSAAAALVLAGCSASSEQAPEETSSATASAPAPSVTTDAAGVPQPILDAGLGELSTEELIDTLDQTALADRTEDFMASVRYDELLVLTDGSEESMPLTGDEFYVSFAPYVNQTHDCYYHSLTTCTGELGNADIHVTVTSDAGEVLVDEDMTTFDNGFVGLWLPRDIEATLEVTYGDLSLTQDIATGEEDPTCLTTTQLG